MWVAFVEYAKTPDFQVAGFTRLFRRRLHCREREPFQRWVQLVLVASQRQKEAHHLCHIAHSVIVTGMCQLLA